MNQNTTFTLNTTKCPYTLARGLLSAGRDGGVCAGEELREVYALIDSLPEPLPGLQDAMKAAREIAVAKVGEVIARRKVHQLMHSHFGLEV